MRVDQANAMLALLQEIRDRLPAPVESIADKIEAKRQEVDVVLAPLVAATREEKPARTADEVLAARMPDAVALGHRQALAALLGVLDGWIEGQRSNHDALGHRGELIPCWSRFSAVDIRVMVNDAAREMGILPFPTPETPIEEEL